MRRKHEKRSRQDDADMAAGLSRSISPASLGSFSSSGSTSEIDVYEDQISEPVLVLGVDISHHPRNVQFMLCAGGVFCFSILYGYFQELLAVQLCSRQLGLFLAMIQFIGYTLLAFMMQTYVSKSQKKRKMTTKFSNLSLSDGKMSKLAVPITAYLGLSLLRSIDLGMTNLAMQYINYPAKTLMKSSRVVFTMIFGVFITKKVYKLMDYFVVMCMVTGLAIFMHADANSSAVFQPLGVIMLTISLLCDGAITNMSENIMTQHGVGQDEFIFKMYSIALVAISAAATAKGDLRDGLVFLLQPGTYAEQQSNAPLEERMWSPHGKIFVLILFSSMGFLGSSCAAAITKHFGALTMSITSTARKAMTLFLSFLLFDNECTLEHIVGIAIFISALTVKSLRRKKRRRSDIRRSPFRRRRSQDLEAGRNLGFPGRSNSFEIEIVPSAMGHEDSPGDRKKGRRQQSSHSSKQPPDNHYYIV